VQPKNTEVETEIIVDIDKEWKYLHVNLRNEANERLKDDIIHVKKSEANKLNN
jgi:hypothetical protein